MSSHQATSSSTPPQESTSPPAAYSVSTPIGAAQTMLSFLGQAATARENPNMSTTTAVLGAADTVLSRLVVPSRSSGSAPHRDSASAPHRDAPTVSYAPPPAIRHVPEEVPREQSPDSHQAQAAPASPLAEVPLPQRVSDPSTMVGQAVPGPTSISSHGGGGGRALTPPRGTAAAGARVTRSSYPALPETIPPPRPVHVSHGGGAYRRRSTGPYPDRDSETAWNEQDDEDIYREKNVYQRLKKTIKAAEDEQKKSAKKAFETGWTQNIALGLQVLLGALTTALGAALGGKRTSVAISILGGASTLVASYLARTKGSNEPQFSLRRSQDLDQFLREINAFVLDHGHEYGKTWDDKIGGFRFGLERLLGNSPESITVSQDRDGTGGPGGPNNNFYGQEKRFGVDPTNAGYNGNGKYPVGGASNKPLPGLMV